MATILMGVTTFFIGGGLNLVRPNAAQMLWLAWLFPNTHALDPLRDLILFQAWPADWTMTSLKRTAFAAISLGVGLTMAARHLRRLG